MHVTVHVPHVTLRVHVYTVCTIIIGEIVKMGRWGDGGDGEMWSYGDGGDSEGWKYMYMYEMEQRHRDRE